MREVLKSFADCAAGEPRTERAGQSDLAPPEDCGPGSIPPAPLRRNPVCEIPVERAVQLLGLDDFLPSQFGLIDFFLNLAAALAIFVGKVVGFLSEKIAEGLRNHVSIELLGLQI